MHEKFLKIYHNSTSGDDSCQCSGHNTKWMAEIFPFPIASKPELGVQPASCQMVMGVLPWE